MKELNNPDTYFVVETAPIITWIYLIDSEAYGSKHLVKLTEQFYFSN